MCHRWFPGESITWEKGHLLMITSDILRGDIVGVILSPPNDVGPAWKMPETDRTGFSLSISIHVRSTWHEIIWKAKVT